MIIKKFRYDFTEEIGILLNDFSSNHENEKFKEFQKSWNIWINNPEIKIKLNNERIRLIKEGYEGDVLDKMYKSSRYYCKKKNNSIIEKKQIKHTNRFSTILLRIIDNSLTNEFKEHIKKFNEVSLNQPDSYSRFCIYHKDDLLNEFKRIRQVNGFICNSIETKLKKTYKNRFHNIKKKIVENTL